MRMPPEVGSGSRISDSKTFSRDQVDFFAIFNHFGKVSLFGIKSDQIFLKIFPEAFAEMHEGGPTLMRHQSLSEHRQSGIHRLWNCSGVPALWQD